MCLANTYLNNVSIKLLEPSKHYIFFCQFHMIILDILIIKPRVNIYLSWTVYKVILGCETPHN